jgi:hypothetical protein
MPAASKPPSSGDCRDDEIYDALDCTAITANRQGRGQGRIRPNDHCDGCGAGFDAEPRAPVLIDTTWAKLAEKHETLCAPCLLNRSIERRVLLTVADLVPCEFNRWGSPSWFDLFSQLK